MSDDDTTTAAPRPGPATTTEEPEVPPTETPIQHSEQSDAALAAAHEIEDAEDIWFADGTVVHVALLDGIDQRRIRIATGGLFSTTAELMQAIQTGDLEAMGALHWIAQLKERGLKPEAGANAKPPITYDGSLALMTLEFVQRSMMLTQERAEAVGAGEVDPT